MIAPIRYTLVPLAAMIAGLSGCMIMRPLDDASHNFYAGRPYATTTYETTFYTEQGERLVAAPLRAHIHDLGRGRILVLWYQKLRKMPMSDIRAFTFNTAVTVRTPDGCEYTAPAGEWWFIVHNGIVDTWMKTASPIPPIDYAHSVSLTLRQVEEISVSEYSTLAPAAYCVAATGALLAVVLLLNIAGVMHVF